MIRDVLFQNQAGVVQTGLGICGRVALAVDAFDTPPLAVPGKFGGLPVAPALVCTAYALSTDCPKTLGRVWLERS